MSLLTQLLDWIVPARQRGDGERDDDMTHRQNLTEAQKRQREALNRIRRLEADVEVLHRRRYPR